MDSISFKFGQTNILTCSKPRINVFKIHFRIEGVKDTSLAPSAFGATEAIQHRPTYFRIG